MISLTDSMEFVWMMLALFCLFAEIGTPGLFFFVSFSIGFFAASLVAYLGYSLVTQSMTAIVVAITTFLLFRKFLKTKKLSEVHYEGHESNIDALVGQKGVVIELIKPHTKGRVKIGGEEWPAQSTGDNILQIGTVITVIRIIGNTVIVKSVA